MDRIKVIIVEDEFLIAEDLKARLNEHNFNVIDVLDSGEEALISIRNNLPDLVLMDIQLAGKLDGIRTVEKIKEENDIPVIYLSDHVDDETVSRAKLTYPASYLSKPFKTSDILRALELAFVNAQKQSNSSLPKTKLSDRVFIRTDTQTAVMIPYTDILYIKAGRAYSEIVTTGKRYTLSNNMKNVFDQFNSQDFLRVHRSYVVNINRITEIEGNNIKLGPAHSVQMARNFRGEVLRKINIIK